MVEDINIMSSFRTYNTNLDNVETDHMWIIGKSSTSSLFVHWPWIDMHLTASKAKRK